VSSLDVVCFSLFFNTIYMLSCSCLSSYSSLIHHHRRLFFSIFQTCLFFFIFSDSTPPSRIEAVDLIMKRYDLNRQAASRQLTRHVLPMFHNEGIFLVGGDGDDDDGEEDDNNGGDITDGGGKVAPTTAQQQVQLDDDGGGVSTMMEIVEDNPIHQSKRSIVISGVTSGLGRALLGYFYNHGHTVAGCGRRVSEIQALKVQFPNARLSVVDVSDDKSVQLWADTICGGVSVNDDDGEESTEEVVDLVIANAGVSPETMHQTKTAWEVPREDFDETIDVNIKGVSNMIRHFVPRMLKNNAGTFVAMSSGLGRSPNPYHAAYCASKWAIEGMIKSLAMSLPDGMCAVPLAPGVVQTGMQPDGKNEGSSSSSSGNIDKWIEVAAPMILGLSRKDNGKSLSVKGFYSVRYRQSWSFPDGSGIPERVGHIF
jgi:NAD(P)-dependent dehydrogenase (short-subunit alcohol dehydrogenase family)